MLGLTKQGKGMFSPRLKMLKLPATGTLRAVYFSLGNTPSKEKDISCVQALCDLYDGAHQSIDIAIFSLSEPNIIEAIIRAHQRGLEVLVIADASQSKGKAMAASLKKLVDAGITVKVTTKQHALMHNKVSIVDMQTVATGSFNYSVSASKRNDENLIILNGVNVAKQFYEYAVKRVLENETLKTYIIPQIRRPLQPNSRSETQTSTSQDKRK